MSKTKKDWISNWITSSERSNRTYEYNFINLQDDIEKYKSNLKAIPSQSTVNQVNKMKLNMKHHEKLNEESETNTIEPTLINYNSKDMKIKKSWLLKNKYKSFISTNHVKSYSGKIQRKKSKDFHKIKSKKTNSKKCFQQDYDLTVSPVSGTFIIKEWNHTLKDKYVQKIRQKQCQGEIVKTNEIDSDNFSNDEIMLNTVASNYVQITDEAKSKLSKIVNCIGPYECKLCSITYKDAFELAMHNCPRVVHFDYRCDECNKSFNCPANLASHKRWHKPKVTMVQNSTLNDNDKDLCFEASNNKTFNLNQPEQTNIEQNNIFNEEKNFASINENIKTKTLLDQIFVPSQIQIKLESAQNKTNNFFQKLPKIIEEQNAETKNKSENLCYPYNYMNESNNFLSNNNMQTNEYLNSSSLASFTPNLPSLEKNKNNYHNSNVSNDSSNNNDIWFSNLYNKYFEAVTTLVAQNYLKARYIASTSPEMVSSISKATITQNRFLPQFSIQNSTNGELYQNLCYNLGVSQMDNIDSKKSGESSKSLGDLYISNSSNINNEKFTCKYCYSLFPNNNSLIYHIKNTHSMVINLP